MNFGAHCGHAIAQISRNRRGAAGRPTRCRDDLVLKRRARTMTGGEKLIVARTLTAPAKSGKLARARRLIPLSHESLHFSSRVAPGERAGAEDSVSFSGVQGAWFKEGCGNAPCCSDPSDRARCGKEMSHRPAPGIHSATVLRLTALITKPWCRKKLGVRGPANGETRPPRRDTPGRVRPLRHDWFARAKWAICSAGGRWGGGVGYYRRAAPAWRSTRGTNCGWGLQLAGGAPGPMGRRDEQRAAAFACFCAARRKRPAGFGADAPEHCGPLYGGERLGARPKELWDGGQAAQYARWAAQGRSRLATTIWRHSAARGCRAVWQADCGRGRVSWYSGCGRIKAMETPRRLKSPPPVGALAFPF